MSVQPRRHIRQNTVAYLALVLACTLAPTSAYATHLAVRSSDIVDGEVKAPDVATGGVRSAEILNGTISGADVDESSLGQVPTALQGGLGRNGPTGSCNPSSTTFVACSVVQLTLNRPARVLVIGAVEAHAGSGGPSSYLGECRIGTTGGAIPESGLFVGSDNEVADHSDNLTVMAVTGVFPAGTHSFGIDCNEYTDISYGPAHVVAVALSAG